MRASRILKSIRIISTAKTNSDRNLINFSSLWNFVRKIMKYRTMNNLFIEYDSIVHDTIVNDFIRAEQKLVRMMKMVYEQIADDLDFDIIDEDAQ